jgi:hypothetical protein
MAKRHGLLRIKHLTPKQLAKVRATMTDVRASHEKRADAALILKMHSSLHGKATSATHSSASRRPLKPEAEQKPAGSDGGLFDTQDTTGDLYGGKNKGVTREEYEKAGKTIRDAGNKAAPGVDPAAVGALAKEAAFHVEASARKIADMLLEKDADPAELIRAARDMAKSPTKTTKGLLKSLDRFGSASPIRPTARSARSPGTTIADDRQARRHVPGARRQGRRHGRTYDEALKRQNGRFRSRLDSALDPFMGNKAALERIRDLLAEPDRSVRATAKEREAAKTIRDLLNDVIAYRKEAGEDIGEVKDYFPRVVDSAGRRERPGEVQGAAERLYRDLGVDDPTAAAEAWMVRVLDTHAGLDGGEEFLVASGKPSSSKSREFGPRRTSCCATSCRKTRCSSCPTTSPAPSAAPNRPAASARRARSTARSAASGSRSTAPSRSGTSWSTTFAPSCGRAARMRTASSAR